MEQRPSLALDRSFKPSVSMQLGDNSRRGYLKVFGDVSFMKDGKAVLTFENVKDPQGVGQLVEALKREQGFRGPWPARPWPG